MGIVKAAKLVYEYIRRDEEENIEEVNRAIDGVDVDIKKGDFVAVLGHNGSGKSTLAKHVNGLLLPTEGTVWVGDMDTRDEEHIWDVRKTAGMVFQNPDNQIIGNIVEEDVGFWTGEYRRAHRRDMEACGGEPEGCWNDRLPAPVTQ